MTVAEVAAYEGAVVPRTGSGGHLEAAHIRVGEVASKVADLQPVGATMTPHTSASLKSKKRVVSSDRLNIVSVESLAATVQWPGLNPARGL